MVLLSPLLREYPDECNVLKAYDGCIAEQGWERLVLLQV